MNNIENESFDYPLSDTDLAQRLFPSTDYKIIGDVAEIGKAIMAPGIINLDVNDFKQVLSKETENYVSTGHGCGENAVADAFKAAIDNLPVSVNQISDMLIQFHHPKENLTRITREIYEPMAESVDILPAEMSVQWGVAFNEESNDVKVTIIASHI